MSAIEDEVEGLVSSSDDWPLMRGLLLGIAIGATVAGAIMLTQALRARRASRRGPSLPPGPPLGAEPSPL
jgi:hypothetical protein